MPQGLGGEIVWQVGRGRNVPPPIQSSSELQRQPTRWLLKVGMPGLIETEGRVGSNLEWGGPAKYR